MQKRYPQYKDSGVEWLGQVPIHWELKRLKYLDKTVMGQSPESDDCNKEGMGIPFLQGNADFGHLNPEPSVWCAHPNKVAEKDDILLSVRAPVGAVNIADQVYGIGRGLCAVRPVRSHKRYAYYRTLCLPEELNRVATGSTYTAIAVDQVNNVVIANPDQGEQKFISNYLDQKTAQIDDLIAKKQRMIELLKEERAAVINQAVTKGLDPNAEMKDSGIEWAPRIPKKWHARPVKAFFDVQLGKMLQPESGVLGDQLTPYLKALHVNWGDVATSDLPEMWASFSDLNQYGVQAGDLLVCEGGEVGRAGIILEAPQGCIIQNALHRVRAREGFDVRFFMYVLYAVAEAGWFSILCNKATIAHLTREKLVALQIPAPVGEDQKKIADYLDKKTAQIDGQVVREQRSIEFLKEYRAALISEAVTGKIDIRN